MEVFAGTMGSMTGAIGFLPFFLLNHAASKKLIKDSTQVFRYTMLSPLISFALILAGIFICWLLAPVYLVIFAVTCVAVFLVGTSIFVTILVRAEK